MRTQIFSLLLLVLLSACAKSPSKLTSGTGHKYRNPKNFPTAPDQPVNRAFIRRVQYSSAFLSEITNLYSSSAAIDTSKSCAQWVRISSQTDSLDFIEVANSSQCSDSNYFVEDSSVIFRLNMSQRSASIYSLYFDDTTRLVGELSGSGNNYTIENLCTGAYLYGAGGANGSCVLRVDYMGGFQDLLTY